MPRWWITGAPSKWSAARPQDKDHTDSVICWRLWALNQTNGDSAASRRTLFKGGFSKYPCLVPIPNTSHARPNGGCNTQCGDEPQTHTHTHTGSCALLHGSRRACTPRGALAGKFRMSSTTSGGTSFRKMTSALVRVLSSSAPLVRPRPMPHGCTESTSTATCLIHNGRKEELHYLVCKVACYNY